MPKLQFTRRHSQPIADVKAKVEALVEDFRTEYGKYLNSVRWAPDGLSAKADGKGFDAFFSYDASKVDVVIDLSFIAIPIKGKIETRVTERLDRAFPQV